jgi:hypothetical protein
MKLRILSDGTTNGTRFFDAETGEEVFLECEKIIWTADVTKGHGTCKAELRVIFTECDVIANEVAVHYRQFKREFDSTGDTDKLREDFGV